MTKTILLTGATDGLGALAASMMAEQGHHLLLHGRNQARLDEMTAALSAQTKISSYCCDLSSLTHVLRMTEAISADHATVDVIINNAGVLKAEQTKTEEGLELRFAVNAIAPYLLTTRLLPLVPEGGRIVSLSSAAQRPVNLSCLGGFHAMSDMDAYAQSKLAITSWTRQMALSDNQRVFVSVNPASLLGTKMVKQGFGIEGADISVGADIICRAALSDEFADSNGRYYDNDAKSFSAPHEEAFNDAIGQDIIAIIQGVISKTVGQDS